MASNSEATSRAPRIFISYRRRDCQPQANGLNYGLRHRLPGAIVFMDIDSIPPGEDFEQHIRAEIEGCDIVLVLIGDNWLDPIEGTSTRRLDQPDDFVRIEIESALERGVKLIPVLVEGARMPRAVDLPESIRGLARRHALELSDQRFTADMERLAGLIESTSLSIPGGGDADKELPKQDRSGDALSDLEVAEFAAKLPKRVTKAWLRDNVPQLGGRELAALARVLSLRRGWSDDEIEDYVYCSVDHSGPLIEALNLLGWDKTEIREFVAYLDDDDEDGGSSTPADPEEDKAPIPARVTESWLRRSVPSMNRAEVEALAEVLRRRRWSEGWLIDFVYAHAAVNARPSPRPVPGDPKKSALKLPRRITQPWLKDNVARLNRHEVAALVKELACRGWSEGQIEDSVFWHVRGDVLLEPDRRG